jgi:uncharacterized membrane protein
MNSLKEIYSKLNDDQKMWGAIALASAVLIAVMAVFGFGGSPVLLIQKFASAILVMFLPGYVIHKLFLNNFQLTENRVMDKFIISLGLSIVTVQTLAFFAEYVTVFGLNQDPDERIARQNYKSLIIVALVIGTAFGAKYYTKILELLKKYKQK